MKLSTVLLAAAVAPFGASATTARTTTTKTNLRGGKVVHTRTVHHEQHQDGPESSQKNLRVEPLVAAKTLPLSTQQGHHHYVRVQGRTAGGESRTVVLDLDQLEDKMPHDSPIFSQNDHIFHEEENISSSNYQELRGAQQPQRETEEKPPKVRVSDDHNVSTEIHTGHHIRRTDRGIHYDTQTRHFEAHDQVEQRYAHHHLHKNGDYSRRRHENATSLYKMQFGWQSKEADFNLPIGSFFDFNQTLFEDLHNAPFVVYQEALGVQLSEDESFPVFALPQWNSDLGVFTGFSKHAKPLIFQNVQFLLQWNDLEEVSNAIVTPELEQHIEENNFHASLIIGKSISDGANIPFIGMVISYYQYGREKHVLVPFSKLEDFFDDASEKHILDPSTKNLEMEALHDMLESKRLNRTVFHHPVLPHTERRRQALEDLETHHFQKLFQLLIRRAYLFAYGYADCLLNEPDELRHCLDDTFYSLIKMETEVRGALDEDILHRLVDINHTFHSGVSEACISTQGGGTGMLYGSGSCYSMEDLGAFVSMTAGHTAGKAWF